jgi:hypothetical protein
MSGLVILGVLPQFTSLEVTCIANESTSSALLSLLLSSLARGSLTKLSLDFAYSIRHGEHSSLCQLQVVASVFDSDTLERLRLGTFFPTLEL